MNKKGFLLRWEEANNFANSGEIEKADESLQWCLLHLAKATLRNEKHYYGTKVDTWKTRVWNKIEDLGLLAD